MTIENMFSLFQKMLKNLDNRDKKIESIKANFDKELGISKEEHDKVSSLIDQLEDSQEELNQLDKGIKDTGASLADLQKAIQQLRVELTKPLMSREDRKEKHKELDEKLDQEKDEKHRDLENALAGSTLSKEERKEKHKELDSSLNKERAEKHKALSDNLDKSTLTKEQYAKTQGELDDKIVERNRLADKKDRLQENYSKEDRRNKKIQTKLSNKGVNDTDKAIAANKKMDADIAETAKGGKMSGALGKVAKVAGVIAIVSAVVKAIEVGLSQAMAYSRVHYENTMRMMSATTTDTVNQMKAGLDSWQDSVKGAYTAQSLAVESQLAVMDAANQATLANTKLAHTWTNWIPIWGTLNKAQEQTLELEQQLKKMDLENAQKRISEFGQYVSLTDDYIKKQDQAVHQYQALNGLTATQTKGFEKRMLANGEAFAKFNKTIEDALKIQNSYSEQSGRAVNFSDSDYTKSFAVGRLVGQDNLTQFQSSMNIFNTSVSQSADIMYDMYNYANKMGLSQQRLTKNVLSNLKLANKYDFKNGRKGFIELAKWAENARMNLASFGGAVEKVQSGGLEGVIKQGAQLQVLGGNFAMNADPIAMMFEGGADQESYAKRIQGMLKGMGSFNKETGETTFNWNENQLLRSAAEAIGMPVEDLKDMARGERQKEYVKAQMGGSTLSEENQDAVANKAQYDKKTGRWYVNTINGGKMDVADVTEDNMDQLLSNNKEENAEKYAQGTLSAAESIDVTTKAIAAKLGAATFEDFIKTTETANQQTLEAFSGNIGAIANGISEYRANSLKAQQGMLGTLGTIDVDIKNAFGTVAKYKADTDKWKQEMESRLKSQKEESQAASNKTSKRWNNVEQAYDEGQNDSSYAAGQKMATARAKYFSARGDEAKVKGDYGGYIMDKANAFSEQVVGRAAQAIGNTVGVSASKVDDFLHMDIFDGVVSAGGKPMSVNATSVTPVHDGTAKIAKTDPNDSALFAKSGGPFDKLFNGVFERINDVYNLFGGNSSNTRLGDNMLAQYSNASNVFGGNSSNTRLENVINTETAIRQQWQNALRKTDPITTMYNSKANPHSYASHINNIYNRRNSVTRANSDINGAQEMQIKALADNIGVPYQDLKSMVMPQQFKKDLTPMPNDAIKQQWQNALRTPETQTQTSMPMELKVSGSIDLKSGGQSFDMMGTLRDNPTFIRELSQLITRHISEAKNGGKGKHSMSYGSV